jgi:hypothetical protein
MGSSDGVAVPVVALAGDFPGRDFQCCEGRLDQCVTASGSGGGSSVAAMIPASSTIFGRPGRAHRIEGRPR